MLELTRMIVNIVYRTENDHRTSWKYYRTSFTNEFEPQSSDKCSEER